MTNLEKGGVYELRSRNLLVGVFNGNVAWPCFIGIRTKFSYRYLDSEVLNDPPGRGTATPIRRLGTLVEGVEIIEGYSEDGVFVTNRALMTELESYEEDLGVGA
jgi:hypothetical protein